jgi:hypothetical protein
MWASDCWGAVVGIANVSRLNRGAEKTKANMQPAMA